MGHAPCAFFVLLSCKKKQYALHKIAGPQILQDGCGNALVEKSCLALSGQHHRLFPLLFFALQVKYFYKQNTSAGG